jgi:hypothetical protein
LAVNGDFIAMGCPYYGGDKGAVVAYKFDSLTKSWNQFNHPITNEDCGHYFGASVVLLEDKGLLIGCRETIGNSTPVYFYSQSDAGIYTFEQKIVASGWTPGRGYGGRLAADENIMIMVTTSNINVFARDGSKRWTKINKIPAEHGILDVAVSGRNALVSSANKVDAFIFQDC